MKKSPKGTLIGVCCGILLLAMLILDACAGRTPTQAGVKKSDLPAEAVIATGTAPGVFGDPLTVEIAATPDRLYSIAVTEHNETEGIGTLAIADLPTAIIDAQSLDVDAVATATMTSNAIKNAIRDALKNAGIENAAFDAGASGDTGASADAGESGGAGEQAEPVGTGAAGDEEIPADAVTATGAAMGIDGDVTVEIAATADRLYHIAVVEHNETEGIGTRAVADLPGRIYEAQSLLVDGVSGATVTSNAIKNAIRAALASAGLDAAPFEKEVAEQPVEQAEDEEYTVDVVVIGAGGAGMTAAVEAADAGRSVLVVESAPMVGGNSVRSTGGMNAAKTPYQDENEFGEAAGVEKQLAAAANYPDNARIQELADIVAQQWADYQQSTLSSATPAGYFDSVELFQLDTLIGGGGKNDPDLVKKLAEDSASAIEWLTSIDADMPSVSSFGGASVKRIHRPLDGDGKVVSVGSFIVPILERNLTDRGVQILLETTAERILTDENDAACGIEAKGPTGNTITVHAKAVVDAAGGFGANHERVEQYRPDLAGFMSTNASGILGQGIDMAEAVGADTVDMDQIQIHPTVQVDTASLITEGLRGDGAILVNHEGKRFYDEVSTRDKVSAAEIAQPGSASWLIVDSRMAEASSVIQGYINRGLTVTGDTYAALAEAMDVDPAAFEETMNTWNACVAAKSDPEFGRTSFAEPLDTAPYYAIHVTAGIHHTMGGLKINDAAQVLDKSGNPIHGLFAAGEVTGGVHGGNRLGGNAVADFVIFGRIAGKSAAAYAG